MNTFRSTSELYRSVLQDLIALLGSDGDRSSPPWDSKLSTLIGLLKERLPQASWIGAYLEDPLSPGRLWVGSYQGKVACLEIPPGKGVCGQAFSRGETLIVDDVDSFPGHIACDAASRSEIVVPLYRMGKIAGVLDLDSYALAAFTSIDAEGLAHLLAAIGAGAGKAPAVPLK